MEEKNVIFKLQKNYYAVVKNKNYNEFFPKGHQKIDKEIVNPKSLPKKSYSRKYGQFESDNHFSTEEEFIKYYGDLFCQVSHARQTFVIEEKENNISIKYYTYHRFRNAGVRYFVVRKTVKYLTFNFKTKRFYYGEIDKKNKKVLRNKSNFYLTDASGLSFVYNLKTLIKEQNQNDYDYSWTSDNDDTFYVKSNEIINQFFDKICKKTNITLDKTLSFEKKVFLITLKMRNIKYPDSFFNFIGLRFKTKDLKKYKMNLVNYVMDNFGIKGDNVRKILNICANINFSDLILIYKILGVDHFNKINNVSIFSTSNYNNGYFWNYYYDEIPKMVEEKRTVLTNAEKMNIVHILNSFKYNEQLTSIFDHLEFKRKLMNYGETVKIKAKTYDQFVNEHDEWSTIVKSYQNGIVERYYGENAKNVEKVIEHNGVLYHPVLFTTTTDYDNESTVQQNCVRTYSEKAHCLIISLRKNSVESKERLTIEYAISKGGLNRVQTKARFNQIPVEEWNDVIRKLDDNVKECWDKVEINLPEIKKTFRNGKIITARATYPNDNKTFFLVPVWDNPAVEQFRTFNYLFDDLP
jgi:hypothetical protein